MGFSELRMLHQLGPAGGATAVRIKVRINKVSSLPF